MIDDILIKESIYEDDFDVSLLTNKQKEEYSKNKFIKKEKFVVLLTLITNGLFGFFWYGLQYSKLPKIQDSDISSKKALILMFIPIFSIYWQFVFWRQLRKRLFLQLKLINKYDNLDKTIKKSQQVIIVPILSIISSLFSFGIISHERPDEWVGGILLWPFLLSTLPMMFLINETLHIINIIVNNNRKKIKKYNLKK